MAELLQADIDELHKVASALSGAATNILNIKAAAASAGLGDALPGSGLDAVCTQAGQFVDGAYQRVAGKLNQVSGAVAQCANKIHETDAHFADEMRKFDVHHAGSR
ncbi:hypothetical protein [Nocardia sp. CDC160]|uniref:hypothetical protein n=1 Tax=Nocardia sp. CDC160 TaxID=3112166 RepID=UPI002DBF699A|nr:hypothetical protein [Nocardia sp. CDC160]MEC3920188.1 hypothetical protein [Nocardia sp. CDC160]